MLQNLPSQVLQSSMSRRSAEIEMDTIQHVALSGDQQPGVRCWPVTASTFAAFDSYKAPGDPGYGPDHLTLSLLLKGRRRTCRVPPQHVPVLKACKQLSSVAV